jgi:hypothetical protein
VGEEGFKATLEGTDSGVATGSSPIMRNPERTEAESSFNRYTGSPVMGVTSQDMDGEETDRGVTDPEEPDRQREREAYAGDADGRQSQDFGNGTANPDGLTTVIDAPEPGANK